MSSSRGAILALGFVCALGLAFNLWMAVNNSDGAVDFNQFYSASHLAGTGQLYNWEVLRKLELEHGHETPTGRLPVVAGAVKLFIGWMPFGIAHIVWIAASAIALILFAVFWPGANRQVMAAALAWSMPAALLLVLGQDTPFWLMFVAIGLYLLKRGSPRLAGIVFALCICKFHLAVGIPILLLAQKRWSALAAGTITGALLVAACFAIEGWQWPTNYLANFPMFSPAAFRMPNLHGIAYWTAWPVPVEILLSLVVVALLWMSCRKTPHLGAAGAAVAAAGLLLGGHAYANDCALLIPLLVFTIQKQSLPAWLKIWAVVVLTPGPVILLTTARPYAGQCLIVGFALAALAWQTASKATEAPAS